MQEEGWKGLPYTAERDISFWNRIGKRLMSAMRDPLPANQAVISCMRPSPPSPHLRCCASASARAALSSSRARITSRSASSRAAASCACSAM